MVTKERLALFPQTCDRCAGLGVLGLMESVCFDCGGTGKAYAAELVRIISMHFAAALAPYRSEMKAGDLVAVCNAHARQVLNELGERLISRDPCQHGRYEPHGWLEGAGVPYDELRGVNCPGGAFNQTGNYQSGQSGNGQQLSGGP